MKITKELWGTSPDGKEIFLYTIENESGAFVRLSSIGAGIVSIAVPDKDGKIADVVLGYTKPEDYFGDGPCAGKCPGRYANRIALAGQQRSEPSARRSVWIPESGVGQPRRR